MRVVTSEVRQESRIARARAGLPRGGSDRAGKEHCLALEQHSGEPSVKVSETYIRAIFSGMPRPFFHVSRLYNCLCAGCLPPFDCDELRPFLA